MDFHYNFSYLKKMGPLRGGMKRLFPDTLLGKRNSSNLYPKGIFITGSHRSGTSWIGKVISQANKIMYWREPFNPDTVNIMPQQYLYIPKNSDNIFYSNFMEKLLKGWYAGSIFDYTIRSNWFRGIHHRHAIKDPTAAFLLEWLTAKYDFNVIIVIRHPAGFVSSILKLGWDFDFNCLLDQQELMQKYLNPYKGIIQQYNKKGISIEKASVLWGIIYSVLLKMSNRKDYIWVRYEDLCMNPLYEFKKLFLAIDLEWDKSVEKRLLKSISAKETFKINITTELNRDTSKMAWIWKDRLSKREVNIIQTIAEQFRIGFYNNI